MVGALLRLLEWTGRGDEHRWRSDCSIARAPGGLAAELRALLLAHLRCGGDLLRAAGARTRAGAGTPYRKPARAGASRHISRNGMAGLAGWSGATGPRAARPP